MKYERWLMASCLFVAFGAIAGALAFWIDPSGSLMGMDQLLKYFQTLPLADIFFQDYVWSGIALVMINGIPNFAASWLLFRKDAKGILFSLITGIILVLWIIAELLIMPLFPIHIIFLVIGIVQTALAALATRKLKKLC